jgi:acyl-[acyl-carrier-protein]-phospholipid O-acyltransferase/long-chain-fatty-acid--[acyl-carrier-protein] ligase
MPESTYRQTLKQRGLPSFLWTQFLGALNDNVFKIVVSMLAVRVATGGSGGRELSIVGAVFILPFLLFSGYAGQLADVYSKRTVLVATKFLEIVAMTLGLTAFLLGHLEITYGVLFLMGLHSTFFSPAKYGILPEILPDRELSRANGILEMSTFVAIVVGTAGGGFLFDAWKDQLWLVGVIVIALAVLGFVTSFGIPRVAASAPGTRVTLNPWSEIWLGIKRLYSDRVLWPTVVGTLVLLVPRRAAAARDDSVRQERHGPERNLGGHRHNLCGDRHRRREHGRRPDSRETKSSWVSRRLAPSAWACSRSCWPTPAIRSGWSLPT